MISKPECMCQLIAFPDGKWQLRSTLCHRSTSKEMIQVCYAISLNVLFFLLPYCRFWCNSNHVCFIEHFYPLFACLLVCLFLFLLVAALISRICLSDLEFSTRCWLFTQKKRPLPPISKCRWSFFLTIKPKEIIEIN